MIKMEDGSILIHAAIDGPFEPVVKVKGIETKPTLMQHHLEHGRPTTQAHADRQEKIKDLIKQMQTKDPTLTFVKAWTILQQKRPELFD